MGLDVEWIPDTGYRGISDKQVARIANDSRRIILTRDSDFLKPYLRKDAKYGIIYIAEPVRKDNLDKLARNIVKALELLKEKPRLIIITSSTIESYPLTS
ncbi:hypothetical protein APE_2617d [Aeropyrum pernix K1]|uniref:DUF5615 domain-containing protein n=1 Tax=Aeropyrum pernix (strain ATCC 700893 / DSM 11879 / JCM 9820 / NBRC 100138 / K1) TaxID=272557 RepID=Q9Y8L3_AERPE|nr:DUF5615 family PIN-like protein [Aeropyrum pernix]BAA81637.1 hypothetical protein APE_2617d [Aeropyrum pernix K1]